MRRFAALAALIASTTALAQVPVQQMSALLYWQKPIGTTEKRYAAATFGVRIDQMVVANSVVFRRPIADFRFTEHGYQSFALRGMVMHQNQPPSGEAAAEPNWWLIVGGTVAAAIVVHRSGKDSPSDVAPKKGVGN